jgi:hypothetical protein
MMGRWPTPQPCNDSTSTLSISFTVTEELRRQDPKYVQLRPRDIPQKRRRPDPHLDGWLLEVKRDGGWRPRARHRRRVFSMPQSAVMQGRPAAPVRFKALSSGKLREVK